ncbi:hypothetical protein SteCoe_18224 [Stentor coeruleus]|uniref:Tyrosine-protein kinase ephrin type A/B receptor-like domain-containing protein n=1 Tax=Stentor coeruleus TaxID=5963 RepID=A0A1R2BX76_9CILI|nr:hypothetical protein SteCoe_18224 [Stentor coeruleus]
MWEETKLNYSPPPMLNFAYKYFANNGSEYFVIVGHQVTNIIVESYLMNIKDNIWVKLELSFSYDDTLYDVSPVYSLSLSLDYYENSLIVLSCRNIFSACDFYIHNLDTLETKRTEFYQISKVRIDLIIKGGIIIDNDYYVFLDGLSYYVINLLNPDSSYWKNIISEIVPNDNSAYISVNNTIFYFGGYFIDFDKKYKTNTILADTISNSKLSQNVIYKHYESPPLRLSSSLHNLRGELWLFGGKGKDILYNDIWKYDSKNNIWTFINPLNKSPSPRSFFSSAAGSDVMLIWGGEDESGFNNDMNIYNIILNTWTTIVPSTYAIPSKRKSACMAFKLPYAYIYGGIDSNGVEGDLWEFSFGDNTYNKLSEYIPISNSYCAVNESDFKVTGGFLRSGKQSLLSFSYNFASKVWDLFLYINIVASEGIYLSLDDYVFILGGHIEYKYLQKIAYLYNMNNINVLITYQTDDLIYLSSYTYYNESIYYFGGGYYLSEFLVFSYLPMPAFGKVDMANACKSLGCKIQCSKGFYMQNGICNICPPGTYAEGAGNLKCTKCPKGCYNPYEGADSLRQCYPCKEGTFNNKLGARFCKMCPTNRYCPAGSEKVYDLENKKDLIVSIQPKIYESSYSSSWTTVFQFLGFGVIFCILLAALYFRKIENLIRKIDYFTTSHNHKIGEYIQLNKTFIGGQFTVILIGTAIITFISLCIIYILDNITEVKTLMPMVILENYAESFKANIEVNFELKNYGDSCFGNDSFYKNTNFEYCNKDIYAIPNNLNFQSNTINCLKNSEGTCLIKYKCFNCEISLDSTLKLVLIEKLSYATGILVNITSESSIPESSSTVAMQISPDAGNIFIGPSPSEFFFAMTPSYFTSSLSNFPSKLTGYHISPESSPKPGSQNMIEDISIATQLSVKLNFFRASTGLYTSRYEKQSLLIFISGLFGTLSGLVGLIGILMNKFEELKTKKRKIASKKKTLKIIISNQEICKMNFDLMKSRESTNEIIESQTPSKNFEVISLC